MSPRPYRSDRRTAAAEETRRRVLAAAREHLSGPAATRVSVDAVAKAADVSRQTVYNAFGSKSGLLEALFDSLAEHAGLALDDAFAADGADEALADFCAAFCRFWESERPVVRRLRGLAVLDDDLERLLRERDRMRRAALSSLLGRFGEEPPSDDVLDLVWQLTSFESFDLLAGREGDEGGRTAGEVADLIARTVASVRAEGA
ncbi:TetR/AcrR family transcriptional regulator [Actinomadura logoneensis]|uniref:TetR/AcrR family transcriptional regulator n=1 Tax=Actinomadura logoneensis TaxID=2293572 RepID=A0A372JMW6_9ACTN|nr:TetR/AcrR family transcriptional regulator [Actinomadura logoneensis]RFU40688.1 TetR/AcrR family transcriptional regulator [Actinomadura logoneensis]